MVRRRNADMLCVERENAAHPEQWSWGDPLIHSQWVGEGKVLTGEGLVLRLG